MGYRSKIQVELVKLVGGDRLMRLTDLPSGLVLETKLDPKQPVVRQKKRLFAVFEAALAKAELSPA